jgi:trehalose-6-phosphatase
VITEIQTFVHTRWATLSIDAGLELHPFDGGMELRVSGQTKGSAVQQLLQEVQPDAAAFLGDDKTDEQAFEALAGHGLCVHVRPEPQKSTQATVWLRPPEELLAFLDAWIEASER